MHPYGHQPMMMGYGGFGSIVVQVIVIVILVCIVMWILRMVFGGRRGMRGMRWGGMGMMGPHMGNHGAMSVLRERYAKGEITKEEFEERKSVLMQ